MHWLYTNFLDYCKNQGIQLLRDDLRYIERQLIHIPRELHRSVMRDYVGEWRKGITQEKNDVLKQNTGRKRANTWIREEAAKN